MKKLCRKRLMSMIGTAIAAAVVAATVPFAGMGASAAGMKGAFFTSGDPAFAYVITGIKPEATGNTVKLYQNDNMQSYYGYNDSYIIPEQVYDADDMFVKYTVTEIGGAVGTNPGALEGVALRGITLPNTVTTIGARAFADCTSLKDITFPTSVTKVSLTAFEGTSIENLNLSVCENTILTSDMRYTAHNGTSVSLPCALTDMSVIAPLTVAGNVMVTGDVGVSNTGITVQPGSVFEILGQLSGTGVIEVKDNAELVFSGSASAYRGSVRLTGEDASFINNTALTVAVTNANGKTVSVTAGETLLGSQQQVTTDTPETPDDETESGEPKITANEGGKVSVEEQGKVIVITADEGYSVENVIINGLSMGSITRYEFETVSSLNTVVVTFAKGETPEGPAEPSETPAVFTDVSSDASYAEAVAFLTNNGIFQGVSGTSFAPNQKASRAMFLSVLKRLEIYGDDFCVKNTKKKVVLDDVPEDAWYAEAAVWAVGTDIFNLGSTLQPNRLITREEAALCLYRYTHARGYATILEAGQYHSYRDSTTLQSESRMAMVWAASNGYLKTEKGILNPGGGITRAEMAEMFARYLKRN